MESERFSRQWSVPSSPGMGRVLSVVVVMVGVVEVVVEGDEGNSTIGEKVFHL